MTAFLTWLLGRIPIGWLQLTHNKGRFWVALFGVAFANVLVFVQLGMLGALNNSTIQPYQLLDADIIISASDSNTLLDGGNVARQHMLQALAIADVKSGASVYFGKVDWRVTNDQISAMQVVGMPIESVDFIAPALRPSFLHLSLADTALVDRKTRGGTKEFFDNLSPLTPAIYELNNRQVKLLGAMEIGAGFSADGNLLMSDQSFLRLSQQRSSAAPNHILLKVKQGASIERVVTLLKNLLPEEDLLIRSFNQAAADEQAYQTSVKPVGIIFGFGTIIGVLVGIVIVYQILSTDVADHLKEYATFKAIGYKQAFFLGIVFEEALILAVLGFIPGTLAAMGIYKLLALKSGLPVGLTLGRALMVFIGTIVACSISGAIATRRLSQADPADLF
ncbi:ABC transporter permease DevC [Cohaesibacter gelatinilyticus]|uniref:Putative ABC transport system permease protein n=1 Tax=Cohaesibacter gelatinilyticus TaxID=372072 RepID=A0A285PGR6_9HYPH|nr:ABC transporter permease DevC [Cohaesibacter gelatinilyticus]SNZ20920.1 putative ABC transport system permease protein [Cohaesibacter gelatinilyticus]HAT84762.1 ABC transporter permease [Hyphomicrobiales bacterium]